MPLHRFIDPAFSSEFTLTGLAADLYETARPEFDRLKMIKELGVISYTGETAIHSKYHHLVGLLRIFNRLCEQPKASGLPKQFLWSFWCRLCFGQTGHAAFSYDAEKGVLLACQVDQRFREEFEELLLPVAAEVAACTVCGKRSACKKHDHRHVRGWLGQLIDGFRWRHLHLWVAALKLSQNPELLALLNSRTEPDEGGPAFGQAEAFKMLVCPDCQWEPYVRRLNRLDYVVRDLAFTGRLNIHLDIENLIANVCSEHSDWHLFEALDGYLIKTLYGQLETQTTYALLQRAIANLLVQKKLTLQELFGLEGTAFITDDGLKERLCKTRLGQEIFDEGRRRMWRTWELEAALPLNITPYEFERQVNGQTKTYLTAASSTGVFCHRLLHSSSVGVAMRHGGPDERPALGSFLKTIKSVAGHQYPLINAEKVVRASAEGLFGYDIQYNFEAVVKRLAQVGSADPALIKDVAQLICTQLGNGRRAEHISLRAGGMDHPLHIVRRTHVQLDMDYSLLNRSPATPHPPHVLQDAAQVLWRELLCGQPLYFPGQSAKLRDFIRDAQERLLELISQAPASARQTAASDLEYYVLLESLLYRRESGMFRLSIPNLKLVAGDRNIGNEYDVVSIIAGRGRRVDIWIWGVTMEKDINHKRTDDLVKMHKLGDMLQERWQHDVNVVCNYVYRTSTGISLEIDGTEIMRPFATACQSA